MSRKVLKGALLGGLVLWLWSVVYWAISGIPVMGMSQFKDEAAVERVLRENAHGQGFYAIPTAYLPKGADPATFGAARMEKIAGDFFFAGTVWVGGVGPFGLQVGRSILGNVGAAGLATFLLLQTAGLSFVGRVAFVKALAFFAWVVGVYPMMVWWGQPSGFVLLQLLDFMVGWGLAGSVLAWLVGDRGAEA